MRWQHTKGKTLSDEQVESHIREWNERAEKMEKMSVEEAKRFVSGSQPDLSNFLSMTTNMQHKIRKEAPSKDAEKRLMEAWKRHTRAYQKVLAMLTTVATPSRKTTTAVSQIDSCTYTYYRIVNKAQLTNFEIFTQQTQAPANRNARSKQWQP